MKILILGANGMIGHSIFKYCSSKKIYQVFGTVRSKSINKNFINKFSNNLILNVDLRVFEEITNLLNQIKPNIIINCVGITKHVAKKNDYENSILINSLLPHRLINTSKNYNTKLIQISTDCVFSGRKGFYNENDIPDSHDIYGQTKALGEALYERSLTIRTSTIGHELITSNGLLEWFLKQEQCDGFSQAIFSGLTTLELSKIIVDYIIPKSNLHGLFHVGSNPISKYELLKIISKYYKKNVHINPSNKLKIDRSLDSRLFQNKTGYKPLDWDKLIQNMLKEYRYEKFSNYR